MEPLNEDAMRERVLAAVYEAGSQRAFATRVGLSESTLSKVLNGRRAVGRRLAEHMGFSVTVQYQPREGQS